MTLSTSEAEDSILAYDPELVSMRLEGRADHAAGQWTSLPQRPGVLQVRLTPQAGQQYEALRGRGSRRLPAALQAAARAHGSGKHPTRWAVPLGGSRGTFRLWVGDMRVVYDVLDIDKALLVLAIVDRTELKDRPRGR